MLSVQGIIQGLQLLGIKIESVKFDVDNRRIKAKLTRSGEVFEKIITFDEIENIFSQLSQSNEVTSVVPSER